MSSTKDFGFMKTLKVKNWCVRVDSIFMRGIRSVKTFVFVILFFSFLCHTKYRTIKGGRGKTKEKYPSEAHH